MRPQSGAAEALLPAVRAAVARVDKEQPVTRVRTIDVVAAEATSRPRFRAVLVGTFAAVALALAMVGVFGVLAYSVQQRVREFGVRIAMGAAASDVMRLVLGNAAKLTLIGLAVGLIAAAALTRYLSTLLYAGEAARPGHVRCRSAGAHRHRCDRGCSPGLASGACRPGGGVSE